MQPWHLLAGASVLFGSIASLIVRSLMKHDKNDPVLFTVVFQCMLGIFTLVYALYHGFIFPFYPQLLPRIALSGLLYAIGSLCNFLASRDLEAGEMTILASCGTLITIALGVFLLGNAFTLRNGVGTVLILTSLFVLYGKERLKMNRGVWYTLAFTLCFAVAIVNDVVVMQTYDVISYIPIMSFFPGLIIALLFYKKMSHIRTILKPKSLAHVGIYSFFYSLGAITFYLALSAGASISQLSPITRATIVTTVILSALFLKERENLGRKMISAFLVTIGVILLR